MSEKHALIVEDVSNWVKQHQLALDELGFKTSAAQNYTEALRLLRRERFDLAIVDLSLTANAEPENLNGIFLLDNLVDKNIPVIVVTKRGSRKLVNEIYKDFDVFKVLDKLSFNAEKFKEYVLKATEHPLNPGDHEKKKAIFHDKTEAFIGELLQGKGLQSEGLGFTAHEKQTVQKTKPIKVFISHSAKDKSLADLLANNLRATGVEVWYDNAEVNVGDSILEKIEQGAKSDFMVIILSPDAVASWIVKQELVMFLNEERRRGHTVILPVLHKDCEIPSLLDGRRYADFRENYETGLADLQRSLGIKKSQNGSPVRRSRPDGLVAHESPSSFQEALKQIQEKLANLVTPEEAQRWLYAPLTMFDGRRPIDLIANGEADRVMQILMRLEEGIHN